VWAVTFACLFWITAQPLPGQVARRPTKSKGPRALGLLELAPNGVAHLIPVTIMYDGQFYDASAYKASPVPMALDTETVYEAVKTGVSLGLFTVTGASQIKSNWIGQGIWRPAGSEPKKKIVATKKPAEDDSDKPPVLRHAESKPASPPAPAPTTQPTSPAPASSSAPAPTSAPASAPATAAPSPQSNDDNDEDRPVLRRGKPAPRPEEKLSATASPTKTAAAEPAAAGRSATAQGKPGEVQIIPAISDAAGPEPRPYAYTMKPEEEQAFRKQMLALAANEVRTRDQRLSGGTAPASPSNSKSLHPGKPAAKLPQPIFDDVRFRVFDLSNSNEPVLVLSAKGQMPPRANVPTAAIQYFVTLVAREEIYGELHKAFTSITDTQHLDAIPRVELVDAVDADGDGRGELLFRQSSDAGTAFVVYRVIGDQLWPLFQGTSL
jgi:hypothetical protein